MACSDTPPSPQCMRSARNLAGGGDVERHIFKRDGWRFRATGHARAPCAISSMFMEVHARNDVAQGQKALSGPYQADVQQARRTAGHRDRAHRPSALRRVSPSSVAYHRSYSRASGPKSGCGRGFRPVHEPRLLRRRRASGQFAPDGLHAPDIFKQPFLYSTTDFRATCACVAWSCGSVRDPEAASQRGVQSSWQPRGSGPIC